MQLCSKPQYICLFHLLYNEIRIIMDHTAMGFQAGEAAFAEIDCFVIQTDLLCLIACFLCFIFLHGQAYIPLPIFGDDPLFFWILDLS